MGNTPTGSPLRLAVAPTGMRRKLLLAFLLMSAVPLAMLMLVAGWFAFPFVREFYRLDHWFPLIAAPMEGTWWVFGLLVLTVLIAFLGGIYLAIKIVHPVIRISQQATKMAQGDYEHPAATGHGGELDDLTWSLNQLTSRIRNDMVELKRYGERSSQLNLDIHKRVVMFSGLLQIGELISSGGQLDLVLDLVVEKLAMLEDHSFSFFCLQPLEGLPVTLRRTSGFDVELLRAVAFESAAATIDAAHPAATAMRPTWEQLGQPNVLIQPVVVRKQPVGILGIGNRNPHYQWSQELTDLMTIFTKQASLAIENELLRRTTKALAIYDELTGVYNEAYMRQRLGEEIQRAVLYQRPCALAMFQVEDLADFRRRHGDPEAERTLKQITRLVQACVTDVDRVGRLDGNLLAVVLPECNKRQAAELMEQICQRVLQAFAGAPDPLDRLAVLGSVSENPVDGSTAEELITKALDGIQRSLRTSTSKRDG